MRILTVASALGVALLLGGLVCSCTPSPEEAMTYNLELIRFEASDTDTRSASEEAGMYTKRLGMHRRNSNMQEDTKPQDYMDAYDALSDAWGEAQSVFPEDVNMVAFLKSPAADRKADLNALDSEQRKQAEALRKIDAAYAGLVKVAAAHGVTAPPDWF